MAHTNPTDLPWANIRSVSTTSSADVGKIKRPRRAQSSRRRQATPLASASLHGPRTPVTLTLTTRTSSEVWMEVCYSQGRFFVPFDASVFDLVQKVIHGGFTIQEHTPSTEVSHRRAMGVLAADLRRVYHD